MVDPAAPGARVDAALGLLVALPALALLAPVGSALPPLIADPAPEATAAGWIALATLPALAWLVLRGAAARPTAAIALFSAWVVALAGLGGASDQMGADRMGLVLASATALVVTGATLGERGRVVLMVVSALIGLALVATAGSAPRLFGLPGHAGWLGAGWQGTDGWTGLVGNTGDLSEAALPAGILGLGLFLHGPRWLRVLGLAGALAHALYSGLVPVHAGTLGWLAAAAVAWLSSVGRPETKRLARLALVAALVAVAATGARTLLVRGQAAPLAPGTTAPADTVGEVGGPEAAAADPAELGGVPFRLATWRATLGLVAATPLGVGAGQFQAAFPPHRDRAELEASSHQRREPTPQEVEHPHNDALLALAELGLVGGGAFLVFLALTVACAVRALRGGDPVHAVYGLAVIALLVNALVNAPLLGGTLSAALAWPILGVAAGASTRTAVASGDDVPSRSRRIAPDLDVPSRSRRIAPLLFTLVLALQARTAWSLVQHGRALSQLADARVVVDGHERLDATRLEALLGRALAARPDSVVALEKRHELLLARGASPEERRLVLARVLEQRPHTFSARLALGNLEATAGNFDAARAAYAEAAETDGGHPTLLGNRLTLALDARDVQETESALAAARAAGVVDATTLEQRAAAQLLRGRLEVAAVLLREWAPRGADGAAAGSDTLHYDPLDANDAHQSQKALREAGRDALADGFLSAFHLHMARENRRDGLHEAAVRMARQALRLAEAWPELSAPNGALRLELALAHLGAGDSEGARAALAEAPIPATDLRRLDSADRGVLVDSGLVSIQAGQVVVQGR
jgi:O-antigen ligase/tetratricopeptide (TPR) repeat protein